MKRSITPFLILLFLFSLSTFFLSLGKATYPKEYIANFPVQTVWEKVHDTLKKLKYKIEKEDKGEGKIITKKINLLSGLEACSELKKIAIVPTNYMTLFEKGFYYLEIKIKFLTPEKTIVIPHCYIKGEKISVSGKKEWVKLRSRWTVEFRFLNQLSILLTGKPLPKKYRNFWDRNLEEIDIR